MPCAASFGATTSAYARGHDQPARGQRRRRRRHEHAESGTCHTSGLVVVVTRASPPRSATASACRRSRGSRSCAAWSCRASTSSTSGLPRRSGSASASRCRRLPLGAVRRQLAQHRDDGVVGGAHARRRSPSTSASRRGCRAGCARPSRRRRSAASHASAAKPARRIVVLHERRIEVDDAAGASAPRAASMSSARSAVAATWRSRRIVAGRRRARPAPRRRAGTPRRR